MKAVFDMKKCVNEIIEILVKNEVSIDRMNKVLDTVKQEVYARTIVHPEDVEFVKQSQ